MPAGLIAGGHDAGLFLLTCTMENDFMGDNLSTGDYADIIAESLNNGQRKQAVIQWRRAIRAHCNPEALLNDIYMAAYEDAKTIIQFCGDIFNKIDK